MSFPILLLYISPIIWLLPVYRQFKQEYFLFFLILGLSDIFTIFLFNAGVPALHGYALYGLYSFLQLLAVSKPKQKIYVLMLVLLGFAGFLIGLTTSIYITRWILAFNNILILLFLIKNSLKYLSSHGVVPLFNILFIFYELTRILKFVAINLDFNTGQYYIVLTNAFEISLGLYFGIFTVNSPPRFKLPTFEEKKA